MERQIDFASFLKYAQTRVVVAPFAAEGAGVHGPGRSLATQLEVSTDNGKTWMPVATQGCDIKQLGGTTPTFTFGLTMMAEHPGTQIVNGRRCEDGTIEAIEED